MVNNTTHTYKGRHAHTMRIKVLWQAIAFSLLFYLEQEHSKDEKKLLSLLQEEQEEIISQQVK